MGFNSASEASYKRFLAKIPWWPLWSSETLESKALIPNVMQRDHKIEEELDQRLQNKPLQGGNLLYIKNNEQFLDDTNDKASFLYIGV